MNGKHLRPVGADGTPQGGFRHDRFRELLIDFEIPETTVYRLLKCSDTDLDYWYADRGEPTYTQASILADLCQVPVEWLYGAEFVTPPQPRLATVHYLPVRGRHQDTLI